MSMTNNKNYEWLNLLKISAFTLAEVLIVLGIIGIIAEITIPTLINNINNQAYVAGLKKGYSELSQANSLLIVESGDIISAVASYGSLSQALKAKLKTTKICLANQNAGECFASTLTNVAGGAVPEVINFAGKTVDEYDRMVLADGSTLIVTNLGGTSTCTNTHMGFPANCGVVVLDVNGLKQPNKLGRDIYYFLFGADGKLLPFGTLGFYDTNGDAAHKSWSDWWTYCNPNFASTWGASGGWACAGRILRESGMNY